MLVQLKNSRYSQLIFGDEILKSCHGILGGKTNTRCKAGEATLVTGHLAFIPSR